MRTIRLTQGYFAIVDDQDYERLNNHNWCVVISPAHIAYAQRKDEYNKTVWMHKEVLNTKAEVDHKNGNGLHNVRSNLRICTHQQNTANKRLSPHSSRYKGVHWEAWSSKWRASIMVNYKGIKLGRFNTEIEAARAYDIKAKELFGEFARLNFEDEKYLVA